MTEDELAISIAETTPAMLWLGDKGGRCLFLNAALRRFWGVDLQKIDEFEWSSTVHPDDVMAVFEPFREGMRAQRAFSAEARYLRADGVYRVMKTEAAPRFNEQGTFLGMSGVNTDITDQIEAERQSRYLMGELNHRTKNLLSVVQAIARTTARTTEPVDFLETFDRRLSGLAASNDLLVNQNWEMVSLRDLVAGQLSAIGVMDDPRVAIEGTEIQICPQHAQTLGMAMHELATNSLKYGALADPDGTLELSWRGNGEQAWSMEWRENVSRQISPPTRRGFGQVVMVDMVEQGTAGKVSMDFLPKGLTWSLIVSR